MSASDLIECMRLLEKDHRPDGWPTVQMQDITLLCDRIEALEAENNKLRLAMATPAPVKPEATQEDGPIHELISAVGSINRGRQHEIRIGDDSEPCYWQRKVWVDWMLELADAAKAAMLKKPPIMNASTVVPAEEIRFRVVQLGPGMRRLDWLNDGWWNSIPSGEYRATFRPKALVDRLAVADKAADLAPRINEVILGLKDQMKIDSGRTVEKRG